MEIRPAQRKDISDMIRLAEKNFPEKHSKKAKDHIKFMFSDRFITPKYITAVINNKTVGFGGYMNSPLEYNIYEIFWVNVNPDYRGNGIGTKIVEHLIKDIESKKDLERPELIILRTDKTAFYKKFGFRSVVNFDNDSLMIKEIKKEG